MVDDGTGPVLVFVDAETNVDVRPLHPGDTVEITGFAGQYDDHYEVIPRAQVDVRVLPNSPGSISRSN
jgi:DNA/RNA endonuclease YhcR with UshA esterase domain